jgi:hypothetical protein
MVSWQHARHYAVQHITSDTIQHLEREVEAVQQAQQCAAQRIRETFSVRPHGSQCIHVGSAMAEYATLYQSWRQLGQLGGIRSNYSSQSIGQPPGVQYHSHSIRSQHHCTAIS